MTQDVLEQNNEKGNVPKRLWNFCLVWESEIITRVVSDCTRRAEYKILTSETPDISEWLDFDFYEWIQY